MTDKFLYSLSKYQRAYGVLFAIISVVFMLGIFKEIRLHNFIQAFLNIVSSLIWMFDAYLFLRKKKVVPPGIYDNEKPPEE